MICNGEVPTWHQPSCTHSHPGHSRQTDAVTVRDKIVSQIEQTPRDSGTACRLDWTSIAER